MLDFDCAEDDIQNPKRCRATALQNFGTVLEDTGTANVVQVDEVKMARPVALLVATCAVGCVLLFWLMFVDPLRRHSEFCEVTHAELMSLAKKRPANLTREQWHHIVVWTLNG